MYWTLNVISKNLKLTIYSGHYFVFAYGLIFFNVFSLYSSYFYWFVLKKEKTHTIKHFIQRTIMTGRIFKSLVTLCSFIPVCKSRCWLECLVVHRRVAQNEKLLNRVQFPVGFVVLTYMKILLGKVCIRFVSSFMGK